MNYRWQSPTTGRFVSKDPIFDGVNWYAYAYNNPINFIDPLGLWGESPEPEPDQNGFYDNIHDDPYYADLFDTAAFWDNPNASDIYYEMLWNYENQKEFAAMENPFGELELALNAYQDSPILLAPMFNPEGNIITANNVGSPLNTEFTRAFFDDHVFNKVYGYGNGVNDNKAGLYEQWVDNTYGTTLWDEIVLIIDDILYGEAEAEGLDKVNAGLEGLGMMFDAADAVNALIYLGKGEFKNAGFSAIAIIPLAGTALARLLKGGGKAIEFGADVGKHSKKIEKALEKAAKNVDKVDELVNIDTGTANAFISEGSIVRHELKALVNNRQMVMTETAISEFKTIVNGVAGPSEQARAMRFLDRVKIIPDNPSARALALQPTKKVGANDIIIFGTGDALKAITSTADAKFVRGASVQGVDFDVFIHKPVPLTGN